MKRITSGRNPLIKEVKSLKTKKYREEKGKFFIEGIKLVEEALKERADIRHVFVTDQFLECDKGKAFISHFFTGEGPSARIADRQISVLPECLLAEISDTKSPQGIMAVAGMRHYALDNTMGGNNLFIVLDSLQDPGNMGTIIRTADAAGFTAVIALEGCVDVYNPKVIRSTMGSIFRIPVIHDANPGDTIRNLKSHGIKVCATNPDSGINCFDLDMRDKTAIILGNESKGISMELAASADVSVRIPMLGRTESLNVSIAASLLMYESVRQRLMDK